MSFAGPRLGNAQMAEINITPLVDVMLVLLVIFMIALPAVTGRVPFDLPQVGPPSEVKPLQLAIGAGDLYTLDGIALSRAGLRENLAAFAARTNAPILEVRVDPEAEYDSVVQGMAIAHNAGIDAVVMADR